MHQSLLVFRWSSLYKYIKDDPVGISWSIVLLILQKYKQFTISWSIVVYVIHTKTSIPIEFTRRLNNLLSKPTILVALVISPQITPKSLTSSILIS